MKEKWKSIPGYEGYYAISDLGRVKRLSYKTYNKFHGNAKIPSKILTGAHKDGYKQIALFKEGIRKLVFIHRLVAESFIENTLNKDFVNHIDSNRSNNNVSNLEWVTNKENLIHAHKSGKFVMPRGVESTNTSLTNEIVSYIKDNPDSLTQKELALKFGISQGGVSKIKNNKNWKYHE